MTTPDDRLGVLLRSAADDVLERDVPRGPDPGSLWGRGRRATWAVRAAAAGLAVLLVLVLGSMATVLRPAAVSVPAGEGATTYPEYVSDFMPGYYQAGDGPVFGVVTDVPRGDYQASSTYVIDRSGVLAKLPPWAWASTGNTSAPDGIGVALAPDGQTLLGQEGVVDFTDGSTTPTQAGYHLSWRTASRGVWSPDSAHVLVDALSGPLVLDRDGLVTDEAGSRGDGVLPAGWRDATTLLGVRATGSAGGALEVVTHALGSPGWATATPIPPTPVDARTTPDRVYASPDGSRLLLVYPGGDGNPTTARLVDARSGQPVAFTGAGSPSVVGWGTCDPVWQAGQPLLADSGLRRPAGAQPVVTFSGRLPFTCVTLAGNRLTGTPVQGSGVWRDRVWKLTLPLGGVLVLLGGVWMVVALRRSRRHGEDFLPMVLRLPF